MFLINFPLMLVPLAVYNFFLVAADVNPWEDIILRVDVMSGGSFSLSTGEGLLAVSLILLLGELAKAAHNRSRFLERILSAGVFTAFAAEFLLLPRATTPTFFLLSVMALIAVVGSIIVAPRHATSPIAFDP